MTDPRTAPPAALHAPTDCEASGRGSVNPNIETALAGALLASRRDPASRESFYASSIGLCPRKQVGERAGLPPTNPPEQRAQFKMGVGTVIGKWVQDLLMTEGYLEKDWHEKRVTYRSYVGRVDGYTLRIPDGAIVEIKTADDDSIARYREMPESYLWQGMFYCLAANVPNLLLFQLGKNQGLTRHRVFPFDAKWKGLLEDEISRLERAWTVFSSSGQLPEHFHRYPWEDKWCPFNAADDVQQATRGVA